MHTSRGPRESRALQSRVTIAFSGGQEYGVARREADTGNSSYRFQALPG
jgi:hypothetical protein